MKEIDGLLNAAEYDKARDILLGALKHREDSRERAVIDYLLRCLETTWLLTEKYAEGVTFFSEYINRYPKDSVAYSARAAALWYSGQLQRAVEDYSRALELKPSDILSLSGRGQVLAELGQGGRAMEDLNTALAELKVVPSWDWVKWYQEFEAFVYNGRGLALHMLGEYVGAMEEFELSISLSPENAWVYFNRATVYEAAGHPEKAFADYQMALTKNSPPLNPIRKQRARGRVRELSGHS